MQRELVDLKSDTAHENDEFMGATQCNRLVGRVWPPVTTHEVIKKPRSACNYSPNQMALVARQSDGKGKDKKNW